MKPSRLFPALVAGILAFGIVVAPAGAGKPFNVTATDDVYDCTDGDDDAGHTLTYNRPELLWPPNHKPVTVTVTAADSDTGSTLTVLDSTGSHSQYTTPYDSSTPEQNGAGNTTDDISPFTAMTDDDGPADDQPVDGSGSNSHQVRKERAGGDRAGRWYRFDVVAMWGDEHQCDYTFYGPWVPHDMRPSNRTPPTPPSTGTEL